VHFRAEDAAALQPEATPAAPAPGDKAQRLTGVSAHNAQELAQARRLNADFAVLGHVLETPSHPGQPALGWDEFTRLALEAGMPVFAIGGQSADTLEQAKQHGAHGIAGIRHV
jgi:8-oxo-dGTP diphosphatase